MLRYLTSKTNTFNSVFSLNIPKFEATNQILMFYDNCTESWIGLWPHNALKKDNIVKYLEYGKSTFKWEKYDTTNHWEINWVACFLLTQ